MNNFQRVLKNTSFLFVSEVVIKAIGFLYFVFLARSLSVDLFGRYNLVTSIVSIFSFLPDLGVGLVVVREISKKHYNVPSLLGNSLILSIILSIVTGVTVISFGFIAGFSSQIITLLFVSSITLLFSQIRSIPLFYFDGVEEMGVSAVLKAINSLMFTACGILGFVLGFGLNGIITGFLVGSFVSLVVTWSVFFLRKVKIKIDFDREISKHLVLHGLPLGIAAFSSLVYGNIDGIILERLLSENALGIYSSASKFSPTIIQLLNVPFVVAVYPALSRLSKEDVVRFKKAVFKSLFTVLAWSVPASIFVSLFAGVIPIIFGDKYLSAVPILKILIFTVPFVALSSLLYKVLIIENKQNWYLVVSVFGVVINVVLNLFLISTLSIIGAAVAAVTTQATLFIIYFFLVRRYIFNR